MKLIVGLGNPGKDYQATRHNAGFWWLERLAAECESALKLERKFHGRAVKVTRAARDFWLLQPQTFMNNSGRAVAGFAGYYGIAPHDILVVHDELDLPPGTVRLKFGGGVAGHNGLKDIFAALQTRDFWRLRLGIGHPGTPDMVVDYVLHEPKREERALIEEAIAKSLEVWPLIVADKQEAAMLKLHTKPGSSRE